MHDSPNHGGLGGVRQRDGNSDVVEMTRSTAGPFADEEPEAFAVDLWDVDKNPLLIEVVCSVSIRFPGVRELLS